jgi:hypothetical protein
MIRFAIATLAAFGIVLTAGSGARAQSGSCETTVAGGVVHGNLIVPTGATCTLNDVTVAGNVSVQSSATLTVGSGSKIGGNIEANGCKFVYLYPGPISVGGNVDINTCNGGQNGYQATPTGSPQPPGPGGGTPPGITIGGNFVCENNAQPCVISGGMIRGNAQLDDNTAPAQVFSVTVQGNLSVSGNSANSPGAEVAVVVNSLVGGNVRVIDNSGPGDSIVGSNVINGNLQCQGNTPGVTDDNLAPNTVAGNKLGQCAGL